MIVFFCVVTYCTPGVPTDSLGSFDRGAFAYHEMLLYVLPSYVYLILKRQREPDLDWFSKFLENSLSVKV
jgi:hypothetical protein